MHQAKRGLELLTAQPSALPTTWGNAGSAPNEGIVRFGAPSRFEPFRVCILKGDAYPGNADHGLVHRSPDLAPNASLRTLVTLDPLWRA